MKKKITLQICRVFTSNFSAVKAVSFSAKKLFYWKIPAKVQSCDLAVSVGFWSSTPAGISSCLVYVRAHLVAKERSLWQQDQI